MHTKVLMFAAAFSLSSAFTANAESFTFTSTSRDTNQLAAPVAGGKPVLAAFATGNSQLVYSGGTKSTTDNTCAAWSAPVGSEFQQMGACVYSEGATDKASIVFSCRAVNADQTVADCWGAMTGISGKRHGRTGTISWRQRFNADSKSGTASGTGMWND